jgi:hypothetical protein
MILCLIIKLILYTYLILDMTTQEEYENIIHIQQLDIIRMYNKLQHNLIKLHIFLLCNLIIWSVFGKWRIGCSLYLLSITIQ